MKAIVVGAGPAGLFCAHALSKEGIEVTLIEEGNDVAQRKCPKESVGYCLQCKPCVIIHGVGGCGLFSDGKLNLNPEIGGNLLEFMGKAEANAIIARVDGLLVEHGAKDGESLPDKRANELARKARSAGVEFIPIHQKHIGSDCLPKVIESIKKELEGLGVKFILKTKVKDIALSDGKLKGLITEKDERIDADFVVLAPGRGGQEWLAELCARHGITTKHQPLDVGVRVEVPADIMEETTSICWDPKFHIRTKTHDDFVRTFCTNPCGFVISESYGDYTCVNGHSMRGKKSSNTNFALLVRVALTEPVENTTSYGESIAKMATTIGGGKPIIQRLGDLKAGRRSTWERIEKSYIEPTLREVTPGDISMSLPGRVIIDIKEALDALNKVIPGLAEDSTLLYSPEVKFYALRVNVGKNMETGIKNLFTIGDGAGVSRGIVHAAATGIIAAEEIARRAELSFGVMP